MVTFVVVCAQRHCIAIDIFCRFACSPTSYLPRTKQNGHATDSTFEVLGHREDTESPTSIRCWSLKAIFRLLLGRSATPTSNTELFVVSKALRVALREICVQQRPRHLRWERWLYNRYFGSTMALILGILGTEQHKTQNREAAHLGFQDQVASFRIAATQSELGRVVREDEDLINASENPAKSQIMSLRARIRKLQASK
jgi:hypothetical protein